MIAVDSFKNLNLVFPGGCGGNHMANMITLNNKFTPRFKAKSNYISEMVENYKKLPYKKLIDKVIYAHFFQEFELEKLRDPNLKKKYYDDNKINTFTGHWFHFFANIENDIDELVKDLTDIRWIVMQWPKENSIQQKRIEKLEMPTAMPEMYRWPFKTDSKHDHFKEANDSNGIFFDSDLLFCKNGSENVRSLLKSKWNIELHSAADEIHDIWFTWVKYLVYERV